MADYTVKRIGQMEGGFGGGFRRARAELGVTAFGMQVLDLPAHSEHHPEHDHSADGQEEVFVALIGTAWIVVDDETIELEPGKNMIRVGPDARRRIYTKDERARVLALGGVPGKAYEVPEVTKLGAPS
jgi:mannose-6-phosphate isomerase-like protein (cupin superfamily)